MTATPTPTVAGLPPMGVHEHVSRESYDAWPALNISTLLHGRHSMAHLKAAMDGELTIDTPALAFGRAFHARVLEPDVYEREYVVAEPCDEPIKSGPRKGQPCGNQGTMLNTHGDWRCGQHGAGCEPPSTRQAVTAEDHARIEAMNLTVRRHPVVKLLRSKGVFEASFIAEIGGVMAKGRVDRLCTGAGQPILDLKKCQLGKAEPSAFEAAIARYGYHVRAAWYRDILAAIEGFERPYIFIVVEDQPPYAVACYELERDALTIGRHDYMNLLADLQQAQERNHWPAYVDERGQEDIRLIGLPAWLMKARQSELEMAGAAPDHPDHDPANDIIW